MVALGASRGWTSVSLGLRAYDETTLKQWKRFNPSTARLSITFNRPPKALDARTSDGHKCAVGTSRPYVLWTTPVVLAGKQSDPDGGELTTDFYWWEKTNGARSELNKVTQSNGNNAIVSRQIPAGRLVDGGTYVWQAKTSDGSLSTWSGTCEFTVDATPPPAPGVITSGDYSQTEPRGGVGLAGTFTVAPPSTRPHEVVAYAWTLDSGRQASTPTVPKNANNSATIKAVPLHDGINRLHVWSKDHAGRFSTNPSTFTFTVRAGTGPAAEWTFDETDGSATDISEHGNTATLGGSASRVDGRSKAGKALALNGTSGFAATAAAPTYPHPDTGAATAVRTDNSFTVTARVRLTSTSGVTGQRTAVAASGNRTSAYTLGYSGADNRWRFAMAGADADNPAVTQVLSNAAPVAGRWTHLAAVYDGPTRKLTLYVNGVAQSATAALTGGFNAAGAVTIGKRKWNGADDGFLNGAVDDVRVYSFAETAAKLAPLSLPLPPVLSFTDGVGSVKKGGTIRVTISAGGDTNVTKYRYSLGGTALDSSQTPTAVGGDVTVPVPVGSIAGERPLHAVAVSGDRDSPLAQIEIDVLLGALLSGTVLDLATSELAVGATVRLQPGNIVATTDDDGAFSFPDLVQGDYTVTASFGGRCGQAGKQAFEVSSEGLTLEVYLRRASSNLGHLCTERTAAFPTGVNVLPLVGDDAVTVVALPFLFPHFGGAYRSMWVDTNGLVSFEDPLGAHPHVAGEPLVSAAEPNAVVAPFWDDLVIDSAASIRTAVTGSGSAQQFVVEWRNAHRKGNTAQRLSFAVTLGADGTVTTNYDGLDNATEQGSNALVGLESPEGDDGFAYSSDESALVNGKAIVFTPPNVDGGFETHNLTGKLTNAAGQSVAGAMVQLDPSGLTTTTAADGAYSFFGLVEDSYTVTTRKPGRCDEQAQTQVDLTADTVTNLRLAPDHGVMGYACAVGAGGFVAAGTVLPLTGDDVETDVTLPFPVQFYGRTATTATVSTNGWAAVGGGYLEALWGDLVVDGSATVRTQTTGSAPNRAFVIEWRDVLFIGTSERTTFELVLHENGRIAYHYAVAGTDLQKGGNATVGLEAMSSRVHDYYSNWEPLLTANSSITWTPTGTGAVSGVLTEAVTTDPIANVTVTLNPGNRTVRTSADGSYQFADLPPGAYQLIASRGDDKCLGQYATATVYKTQGDVSTDLSLNDDADTYYHCTTAAQPFITADTVQPFTGDDEMWKVTAPFPVSLYGETTTSPWISTNGFVSLAPEGSTDSAATPVPSGAVDGTPNSAVYPFWGDWVIDDQAAIATKVTGTAPNRQWIVEWRDAAWYGNDTVRVSFEAIFAENGGITFAYDGIDPQNPIERGANATVGIENTDGTVAFQYLYGADLLDSGLGIRFTPDVPSENSITGTVTCGDNPVENATVTAGGVTATTYGDGYYSLDGVPAKTWTVVATVPGGDCTGSTVRSVLVGRNPVVADFTLQTTPIDTGYTVGEAEIPYAALSGTSLLNGHGAWTTVDLPFPISAYGASATTLRIGTEGSLELAGAAYLYPFRGDWVADDQSAVLTAVRGAAPDRQFVVEWRNVRHQGDQSTRFTFQAILDESGGLSFVHPTNDGSYLKSGGMSLIGIQSADGASALLYADRRAVLRPGHGIRFVPSVP
ncbi:carboxypeptidase regulatory-like domain-containing protein [Actinoplanes bogorensis]|uniref:Carboxypeptidase regulatory-like domain-containing protein n=2 Tax=Paractinoplanes bogorensis TaxID=1610840 RepID=A0ABS5YUF8_9ACTN|nr:carboxypeptidase regulatory-like domain-containing protein [Actinoplanes bogorensis]